MSLIADIIYFFFGAIALIGAISVVASRNPVSSALSLVVTMIALAGLYLMMNAELAAVAQIIVYAGAIVVLFLFVIMILNLREPEAPSKKLKAVRILGLLLAAALLGQVIGASHWAFNRTEVLSEAEFQEPIKPKGEFVSANASDELQQPTDLQPAAGAMLTQYILPFELISILLLVAIVGAAAVARRKPPPGEAPYEGPDPEEDELAARLEDN
jgi:NADH-quinone oxidoreductase subunit J